jgi:hypothetical protein
MVRASWSADPEEDPHRPVRFIAGGTAWLPREDVRRALDRLVDGVLERCAGLDDPGLLELRDRWQWIRGLSGRSRSIAARAASLGLDAYDPSDVPAELEAVLAEGMAGFEPQLRSDLLCATAVENVGTATKRVGAALEEAPRRSGSAIPAGLRDKWQSLGKPSPKLAPYRRGWELAKLFRQEILHVDQTVTGADLDTALAKLGLTPAAFVQPFADFGDATLRGVVAPGAGDTALLLAPPTLHAATRRFLEARALLAVVQAPTARLLTDARTSDQSTGRAFATEFLAPAEEVSRRVGRTIDEDEIAELAAQLEVSPSVVRHQIENHTLSRIIE